MQARIQNTLDTCLLRLDDLPEGEDNCLAPMDGTGITGLRLFCSSVEEAKSSRRSHKQTETMLEFPGTAGDWGQKLTCPEDRWMTTFEMRYAAVTTSERKEQLGVVQMRMKCGTEEETDETSDGVITQFGESTGSTGPLETEDPTTWQHGLSRDDIRPVKTSGKTWDKANTCQRFMRGAKVQTDQNNAQLSFYPDNPIADQIGINDVKFTCSVYGGYHFCAIVG